LQKNGVDVLDLQSQQMPLALKLADDYRRMFFKNPRGASAWRNATALDGTLTDIENNKMAESFHYEVCIGCSKSGNTKLKNKDGGWFWICDSCTY